MSEWLPNRNTLAVYRHSDQPATGEPQIAYGRMFKLSVTVWANDKEISWVVANFRIKVMYLEVRVATSFFKSERTELALPVM